MIKLNQEKSAVNVKEIIQQFKSGKITNKSVANLSKTGQLSPVDMAIFIDQCADLLRCCINNVELPI